MCSATPGTLSVDDALSVVHRVAMRLEPVMVPLLDAVGLVLAEDVYAPDPLPPYPASVKDGYAVIASDGPGEYPVIAESRAGNDAVGIKVTSGTIAYVTTGGPIPDGADAVVQVEDTELIMDTSIGLKKVQILVPVRKGQNIRPVGHDIEKGTLLLRAGDLISTSEIGLLASMGITMPKVYPRPVIGVFSTGDELVEPTTPILNRGQIRDSNRAMLLAAAMQQQCKVVDFGISNDDSDTLDRLLDKAISFGVDMVLSSGGVSMGDKDLVKPLLEKRGKLYFNGVLMKPGKPLTFAEISVDLPIKKQGKKILAFGLPGNPVSCIVCFHIMVVPTIRYMSGWENPNLQRVSARLAQPLKTDHIRPEFHRAIIKWESNEGAGFPGFIAESTGLQQSSRLLSMKSANCLLELPATGTLLPAGTCVRASLISDISNMSMSVMPVHTSSLPNALDSIKNAGNIRNLEALSPIRDVKVKVAILTVSDTVASGAGPDRRAPVAYPGILLVAVFRPLKTGIGGAAS